MQKTFNKIKLIIFICMIPLGLCMVGGVGNTSEGHIIGLTLGVIITAIGGYFFVGSCRL